MASSGVPALDRILLGGYPEKSAILIEGLSSNEKEALCYEFVRSGLDHDEFCLYVTRLMPAEVTRDAKSMGVSLGSGIFWMCPEGGDRNYSAEDLASISFGIKNILREHHEKKIRVAFDLPSQLLMTHSSDSVFRFLGQLLADLKRHDAVLVASLQEDMHEPRVLAGLELLFDGVLTIGQANGMYEVNVKKMRGIKPVVSSATITLGGDARGTPAIRFGKENRIAVLPFVNMSADPGDEYFADGITEEMISSVSRTKELRVIARTSIIKYKGAKKSVAEIGRELNVGCVLEGSVRKSGDRVRITAQLVGTSDEETVWSQDYDRQIQDVFAIQSDVSQKVAEALREQVLGSRASEPKAVTRSTEAYVNYLRGRQSWNMRNEEGLKKAVEFFGKALSADPGYAKGYTGLADSYATLALLEFMAPKEAYPRAKEAVSKALSLDPDLAEAHTSLGLIRFQYDWNWAGAEAEFKEAIAINPSYAPAHHFFADYLKAMGRFDEALSEIEKAQDLDPLSLAINTGVGHVLYLSRQYDRAIEQYKRAVELDPNFMATHVWFGRPYLQKGMYAESISELETAVRLSGESTLALGMLGHGFASAGQKDKALEVLRKLDERAKTRYVPSYWVAVVYNGLKDRDETVAWLKKAFEERSSWLVWTNVEPRFDWLRGDGEFSALMKAMNFP